MLDAMEQKPKIVEDEEDGSYQFSLDPLPSEFVNRKVGDVASKCDTKQLFQSRCSHSIEERQEILFPFLPLDVHSSLLDALVCRGLPACRHGYHLADPHGCL